MRSLGAGRAGRSLRSIVARPPVGTHGFALALALVAIVLLEGFAAMALLAASARVRLAGDSRVAVEGDLLVASTLAEARLGADGLLRLLPDGGRIDLPARVRGSGWRVAGWAARQGTLIQLSAEVTLRGRGGALAAARRATLLLSHVSADTVRVSGYRSRY